MDNKMRIVAEEFENTTTGEKVTGVTVMIDGKLRQVFDIMIAKSGYNKSYLEMLQEVLVLGIDEYIKKLKQYIQLLIVGILNLRFEIWKRNPSNSKSSGTISNGMDGFDMLSMGLGMIDPDNPLTALNNKLHQSDIYNGFQMGVSMLSSFSGAASQNMACFIAGTMVLTATGLVAIERLKAGDVVISTNLDTLETAPKTVLETYVRKVDKLVHLTINGEEIVTTDNHPFYVQGRGFINAGSLLVGDKLISVNGEDLFVEKHYIEETDVPVDVYNFQVEDHHTYFVGESAVWVHNDMCQPQNVPDGMGQYKDKKGHHPMAKKAFEGAEGYDYTQALSISSEKLLKDFDVKHSTITGKQASLYREFAKTGKELTMNEMKNIEIKAMVQSGVPKEYATKTVNSAIKQLKDSGITAPVKIPWG